LEVAQIAKSIALKINKEYLTNDNPIDLDVVEFAGLAHDLGHPPFGHNGEKALDECMRGVDGGFEGNAQTLRIISKIEKKVLKKGWPGDSKPQPVLDGKDNRCGLNLTARTLASILKYSDLIPERNNDRKKYKNEVMKGYYFSDRELVAFIIKSVTGVEEKSLPKNKKFKTVECQIMDIADDIAYSTYDLEDAFKVGFLNPLSFVASDDDFYEEIASEIQKSLHEKYKGKYDEKELEFNKGHAYLIGAELFSQIFNGSDDRQPFEIAGRAAYLANLSAKNGYLRTDSFALRRDRGPSAQS
jgi:dGTPase